MAQDKCNNCNPKIKRLTAQEVYQLTSETLQEHFLLDMSNSLYEAQDIWDVLIAAAVERITIEMACDLLDDAPSPNTVRQAVYRLLSDETSLVELEGVVNDLLVARLPKNLLQRALAGAADITEIPYHGHHEEEDEYVRRGRAKHGTTHFHCYATLYIVKHNKRYTLAVILVRRSDKTLDVLKRLLERGHRLGLRLKRLFLDRGFDNNGVVADLQQQSFPTVIPLTIRGKQGGTRALLKGRTSYQTSYTRSSSQYGEQGSLPSTGSVSLCLHCHRRVEAAPSTDLRRVPPSLWYRNKLSIDEHHACPHHLHFGRLAPVFRRSGVPALESVVLRQMVSSVCAQARPTSCYAPSPSAGALAALALGDGQAAARVLIDDNHLVASMIAVY